tara:strand:- start:467 stop:712 length:246 start_codon:yes stop_codon:yes gene_type:complete
MANARGREYGINPLGGPDELNRVISTDTPNDLSKRVYADAPAETVEAEPSTPAPEMEVTDADTEEDVVEDDDELEEEDVDE